MEKYRAIPKGYMRVGELAKKAGVTVRTLQYYDKEGLLTPSAESEGGFRLYTDRDLVKLIQILTMKQLGFGLADIKKRLPSLDTPADVINALTEQAEGLRREIDHLTQSLMEIEALKEEVVQMEEVDFKRYSTILINLQMKNENYWAIKYLDEDVLDRLSSAFDREGALKLMETQKKLNEESLRLERAGVLPESAEGQAFAKAYCDVLKEFAMGDMSILQKLSDIMENDEALADKMPSGFLGKAMDIYFENQEGEQND